MIKLLNHKIINKTINGIVELDIRGEKLKYSYQAGTNFTADDGYRLEEGNDDILTEDEHDTIHNL